MFVIKQMRLNSFEARPVVSNRELFKASGEKPATIQSKDTADCCGSPTIDGASKTKILGLAQDITASAYAKHVSAGQSPDMPGVNAKDY